MYKKGEVVRIRRDLYTDDRFRTLRNLLDLPYGEVLTVLYAHHMHNDPAFKDPDFFGDKELLVLQGKRRKPYYLCADYCEYVAPNDLN